MNSRIFSLLNIKPSETSVVKQLFWVQFFLGVATSFLFTSALTLFLATYEIKELPKVSLLAAGLLLAANFFYARLEARLSAKKLLQVIILFSLGSILFTWLEATFFLVPWLPFFLSAWNMVVYMLVGYAFWGMAAIIFNVRESKRIFSVVGSGDIPAKILGYAAVAVLAPVIGVVNILIISILAFLVASYFLYQFNHPTITTAPDHGHHHHEHHDVHQPGIIERYFQNNLIFVIAIWSLLGFTIYTLIDYTFLTEIKVRYKSSHELASFLGIFFAIGRVLAIFLKLIFSSRVINRLGLTNSLLITPGVLLLITGLVLILGKSFNLTLMIFGVMVLFSEVLKMAVQDPAFFILFQPLDPHSRLKGHLITKGYTMPVALLAVGVFAFIFRDTAGDISISLVCSTLIVLLVIWSAVVMLIKKEYLHTLIQALKKGYFTGTELFLNDQPVRDLLLAKAKSQKPQEVLFALELLERSNFKKLDNLLLQELSNSFVVVKKYVLSRIIHRHIPVALPLVQQQLTAANELELKPDLIKAFFFLNPEPNKEFINLHHLEPEFKKAALLGLASRTETSVLNRVEKEISHLAVSSRTEDKILALEIIAEAPHGSFDTSLQLLLQELAPAIYKQAIEAIGIKKAFNLWPETIQTAVKHQAIGALQKAIQHFGDEIYTPAYLSPQHLPDNITTLTIKTAGKIKGPHATAYLQQFLLNSENEWQDTALEALYNKKANLDDTGKKHVTSWIEVKLAQGKRKIDFYTRLAPSSSAVVLAKAIKSEVEQDLSRLLKAFALIYDRPHLERVLQLYKSSGDARHSNAIEMLELSIPKRYFLPVDAIMEFLHDISSSKTQDAVLNGTELTLIIKEILTAPGTGFNIWTKSVALYLIPAVQDNALKEVLKKKQAEENNPLFTETKEFVLSQVEL